MVKPRKSVLIIDDSETNLLLMQTVLNNKGWNIETASSGKIAMEMIKDKPPDLILLDLLMPEVDGQQMLEWLKSDDGLKDIPVVVISAVNAKKTIETCLGKGAAYYMPKPVKIKELIEIIQKTIHKG